MNILSNKYTSPAFSIKNLQVRIEEASEEKNEHNMVEHCTCSTKFAH